MCVTHMCGHPWMATVHVDLCTGADEGTDMTSVSEVPVAGGTVTVGLRGAPADGRPVRRATLS
ncbi:hypothetical protein CLV71_11356 [Actinophytocola oryzae]|uniref:Uncharacterized protein n=1 Tax=Actinophytocola oryzae TaxID=502181 RepID=A0A4R7V5P3_9PSEU|nr:hypothetical protein CLV71_11356 [Actinophytocola oryzae]